MNVSNLPYRQLELPVAGLWVLGTALMAGGPVRIGLVALMGALWLAVAWKARLSLVLVAFLLFLSVRSPMGDPLPLLWMLALTAGLGAWTCSVWSRHLLSAVASGLMWGGMTLLAPPLWLLSLCGLPRLSNLHGEHPGWAVWPGLLLTGAGVGVSMARGDFLVRLNQLAEAEPYLRMRDIGVELSLQEQLWLILPIVGLFELAQRQTDDHRFNWRNLIIAGGGISLLLVPGGVAVPLLYAVALPVSAFMLTRWYLALPDWPSRILVSVGLLSLAYPLMTGGLS
ncbi:MAG: hypothetical protein WD708_10335 [Kiritimatiellia bacterium]